MAKDVVKLLCGVAGPSFFGTVAPLHTFKVTLSAVSCIYVGSEKKHFSAISQYLRNVKRDPIFAIGL